MTSPSAAQVSRMHNAPYTDGISANMDDDYVVRPDTDRLLPINATGEPQRMESAHDATTYHASERRPFSVETVRLIRTGGMLLFFISRGLYSGIMSPALVDLTVLYNCTIQQMATTMTTKTFGIMAGSFLGGYVVHTFRAHMDLWIGVVSILCAMLNSAVPWCPNLIFLGTLMTLQGIFGGFNNVVSNAVTLAEWKEKAPSPMNAMHMAFTVGLMLAPPTTAPFLNKSVNETNPDYSLLYFTPVTGEYGISPNPNYTIEQPVLDHVHINGTQQSSVYIPFAIHGGFGGLIGLVFLTFYVIGWEYQSAKEEAVSTDVPETNQDVTSNGIIGGAPEIRADTITQPISNSAANSEVITEDHRPSQDPTSAQPTDVKFTVIMALAMFFCYIAIFLRDNTINVYIGYIAMKSRIRMKTEQSAALYNTAYNASWVAGRLLGAVIALVVKIHYLMFGGVFGVLLVTILLVFYGVKTQVSFWILTCALGVLAGPAYPSVMSWADRYIKMRGILVTVLDLGLGAGGFISVYLGGYLLHHYPSMGAVCIFMMDAAGALMLALILIPLQVYCYSHGDRFVREATPPSENVLVTDAVTDNEPLVADQ